MSFRLCVLLTLGLSLSATSAGAEDCSPIDLRPKLGPPRDQDDTGWCFAHTAADLLSAKLGKRVSAYDLAINYHLLDLERLKKSKSLEVRSYAQSEWDRISKDRQDKESKPNLRSIETSNFFKSEEIDGLTTHSGFMGVGGQEDVAILMGQERGFCLAEDLEDKARDSIHFNEQMKRHYQTHRNQPLPDGFRDYGPSENADVRRMAAAVVDFSEEQCTPRFQPAKKFVPYKSAIADNYKAFREKSKAYEMDTKSAQDSLWTDIDELLEKGDPLTIGYSAYDLEKRFGAQDSGDHSAMIVARRMEKGKCQYFLRNSWGTTCSLYTAKFKRRCEAKHGGIWVTKDEIPSLYSVISLSKPPSKNLSPQAFETQTSENQPNSGRR